MDALMVGACALAGGATFAAAYVASGGERHTSRTAGTHNAGGSIEWLVARVMRAPPLARMVERAGSSNRRAECLRQMPVMLDVVTLGLSAGLSFDSSLELYCQRYDNDLSRSMGAAMLSWRLGTVSRDEALEGVARRLGVASLDRFASVVSQALAFGSPLAATLEQQAQTIRDEQRAQMEEEIERVPVKMLIPLGTLIVPAMLMAILGPLFGASLAFG